MLTKYPSCFKYDAPGIINNLKAKEFPPPPHLWYLETLP